MIFMRNFPHKWLWRNDAGHSAWIFIWIAWIVWWWYITRFLFRYSFQFFILTFIVLNFIITVVKNPRLWPFQQQQKYFNTQNTAKDIIERVGGMVNLDQQMRSDITCYYFISFFQFSILAIVALHCIITLIKNLRIWPFQQQKITSILQIPNNVRHT